MDGAYYMGPFQSAASSFGLSAVSLEPHYESEIDTVIADFAGDLPPKADCGYVDALPILTQCMVRHALQEVSSTWQMRSCINVSGL